jgi:hypothetical protein
MAQALGAALLVVAWLGLGRWWVDVQVPYLALNATGGALLVLAAVLVGQWGFAFLFLVWLLAAVRSFVSLWARVG